MRAQDNCIFSISPKAGSLSPGQEEMVEFKYRCSPNHHHPALPGAPMRLCASCMPIFMAL